MLRRVISSLLAAAAVAALVAPAASADETLGKGLEGTFALKGTHGYEVHGLIGATGKGSAGLLLLSVGKKGKEVTYLVHGTVTKEAVDFNLGELGEINAAVQPTGRKETLRSKCSAGEPVTTESAEYVGTIAFHGEEGFTEVEATHTKLLLNLLTEIVCPGITTSGKEGGSSVLGAGLAIKRKGGPSLELTQNHPGARVFYHAHVKEKAGAVTVDRTVGGYLRGGAMTYAPSLKIAHFKGAGPFSGSATYAGKGTWRGNLTVDFPGHADVPLAGPGFKASIFAVHRDKPRTVKPN